MSKIAFFCIPAQGHTNPTLGLVRELVCRGHQVRYYSYEPFRDAITAAGAEFIPCDRYDAQLHLTEKEAARLGSDLGLSVRVLVDTTLSLTQAVLAQMQAWQPGVIVFDSMAPWGKAVAKRLGIPGICSNTTFAFNKHAAKVMQQSFGELFQMLLALPKINRDLNRLRNAGYPVKSVLDLIATDETVPTIVYTSRGFQPAGETFGENFAFVGPILKKAQISFPDAPQVYVSMGTVNNDMLPLYRACIQALEGRTALVSVGQQVDISRFDPLPEGIRVTPRADQIAALEKARAFITHCGMNSVSEALYHGVPLVMNPKTKEQQGVARRVQALGAGILLADERPATIRAALDAVLTDPKYRLSAQKIAADLQSCPGPTGAADFIEFHTKR